MKHMDDCLDYLQELTCLRPTYVDYWNNYGLALTHAGRFAQAEIALERALQLNPQYLEVRVSRCFLYGATDRESLGFREFRQICLDSPDNFEAVFALGVYCMRHGWKETGLTQFARAQKMRPHSPLVLTMGAAARRELGEEFNGPAHQSAVAHLIDQLDLDCFSPTLPALDDCRRWENPSLKRVHVLHASLLCSQGRVEEAEAELLLANRELPGHVPLMLAMGRFLLGRQRIEEALKWLTATILMDDHCDQAHYELSVLHAGNDNMGASIRAAKAAVSLRPMYPDYRYHLGMVLLETGALDDAIREFEHAVVLNPSIGHYALQLAGAYLERDAPERALSALLCEALLDWPEASVVAARAYLQNGQPDEAISKLKQALELDPDLGEARELLGSIAAA